MRLTSSLNPFIQRAFHHKYVSEDFAESKSEPFQISLITVIHITKWSAVTHDETSEIQSSKQRAGLRVALHIWIRYKRWKQYNTAGMCSIWCYLLYKAFSQRRCLNVFVKRGAKLHSVVFILDWIILQRLHGVEKFPRSVARGSSIYLRHVSKQQTRQQI